MTGILEAYLKPNFDLEQYAPTFAAAANNEITRMYNELYAVACASGEADVCSATRHVWQITSLYQNRNLGISNVYRLLCDYLMVALEYAIKLGDQSKVEQRKRTWVYMMQVVIPHVHNALTESAYCNNPIWLDDTTNIYLYWSLRQPLLQNWARDIGE